MQNPILDRLPDPLLVRLYREGKLRDLIDVKLDETRNVMLTFSDGRSEKFIHLNDVGWVPDTGGDCCQS